MTQEYNNVHVILGITLCSVNCFAIITGFVMYPIKFKISRIIRLWFQVFFYGVFGNMAFTLLGYNINLKYWIKAIFPFMTGEYWYFTAYMGMFLFIPCMNNFVKYASKRNIFYFFIVVLFSCVLSTLKNNLLGFNQGYSMLWLIILYLIGAFIKKMNLKLSKSKMKKLILIVMCCFVFQIAYPIIVPYLTKKVFGKAIFFTVLNKYVSPFNLIISICLLIVFSNLNIVSKNLISIINKFSPLMFGCYLIQVLPFYYKEILINSYKTLFSEHIILTPFIVLLLGFGYLLLFSAIDYLRIYIFKMININYFVNKIEINLINLKNKIIKYLNYNM